MHTHKHKHKHKQYFQSTGAGLATGCQCLISGYENKGDGNCVKVPCPDNSTDTSALDEWSCDCKAGFIGELKPTFDAANNFYEGSCTQHKSMVAPPTSPSIATRVDCGQEGCLYGTCRTFKCMDEMIDASSIWDLIREDCIAQTPNTLTSPNYSCTVTETESCAIDFCECHDPAFQGK